MTDTARQGTELVWLRVLVPEDRIERGDLRAWGELAASLADGKEDCLWTDIAAGPIWKALGEDVRHRALDAAHRSTIGTRRRTAHWRRMRTVPSIRPDVGSFERRQRVLSGHAAHATIGVDRRPVGG